MGSLDHVRLRMVETLDDANEFQRWLGERREILAVDTETGGLEWWSQPLRLVQVGDADTGWVLPWEGSRGWGGLAANALNSYEGDLVAHNLPFDFRFLEEAGVDVPRLWPRAHDTSTMAHILDSTRPRALKKLGETLIDRNATRGQELLGQGMAQNGWTWATVPVTFGPYWVYSALDPVLTARLYSKFKPEIDSRFRDLYELEMAVARILSTMERRGLLIDQEYTTHMRDKLALFEARMLRHVGERWPVFKKALRGKALKEAQSGGLDEFITSIGNDSLAQILLEEGMPLSKLTPGGKFSVDDEVLSGLEDKHELAGAVRQLRQSSKFRKSYFEAILTNLHSGRVHPSINPLGARTGRMSVSRPPFQQLPSGSPLVRDCVIPGEGNVLLSVDYDQIELRVLAHYAREQSMIDAIYGGVDLHWANARTIFGDIELTDKHRKMSKTGAFAEVYGAGPAKLAVQLGIPVPEAAAFMERFEAKLPGVRDLKNELERVIRERSGGRGRGYITTFAGRRSFTDRGKEYTGLNYLCQGSAADILKLRLVELDKAGLSDYALLPVHDELIFEVPQGNADDLMREIERVMTDTENFAVPISASGKAATRWGDAYDLCNDDKHTACSRSFCTCPCKNRKDS